MSATGSVCDFSLSDFNASLAEQNSIINLAVVEHIAYHDAYSNILTQETFSSGMGEEQIYAATPRASLGSSMVRPAFTRFTESCQMVPVVAKWGNQRYSSFPGVNEGQTKPICVRQQYFRVEKLLTQSVESIKEGVLEQNSADIRANLLDLSGYKFTVPAPGATPESGLRGSNWTVSTNFNGQYPGDRLTFKYAKWLRNYIGHRTRAPLFGKGADAHAILITSQELNDALVADQPLNSVLTASTQGSFKDGHDALWAYSFIDTVFRGLKLAVDYTELRFDTLNAAGNPQLIEPYEEVATNDEGVTWEIRTAWENANYEVWFMIFGKGAFARLTPESFSGEDGAKWPTGMWGGQLEWMNPKESCNRWQDFGWFQWRTARAIQPMAPHFVVAGISKRCRGDFTDQTDTCPDITTVDVTI